MAATTDAATTYIGANVIDATDWLDADSDKKQRVLNVAARELVKKYPTYTIPDEAVYEFSAVLATYFNDTNRLAAHQIAGFSVTGVGSFTFKQTAGMRSITQLVPQTALDIIGTANAVKLSGRATKWVIL